MRLFLLIIVLVFSIGLPIMLLCKWKHKTGSKLKPFMVGALVFFIFVNFLEGLFHQLFLFGNNPVSAFLNSNAAAYALYAALMAGIFEECGRLFGFKVLLKQNDQIYNSVSYGIGHGGIEIILTLGAAYLVYLIAYIDGPSAASPEIYNAFMQINPSIMIVAMIERVSALMLHLSLSILVFVAANHKEKFFLFPAAVLIHAAADIPVGLYQMGKLSLFIVELLAFIIGASMLYAGIRLYKQYDEPKIA